MTWQEKVAQLESEGRYAEASRVFAFSEPNASYAQKMQFADRLYKKNAFREALPWYEECIGTPIEEEYYYLTENGNYEQDLPKNVLAKLKKGDTMYETRRYKAAMEYYFPFAEISRYAATKTAECHFLLKDYAKAKEIYRVLAQETDEGYFMFMLGECYTHGLGNEYAFEHAAYWYLYALEHGDTYAYYPLGLAYQFGRGMECDPQKAEELFEAGTNYAIDRDNCYCKLGNFCYGRGEYERAREYYEKAAALNNARSLVNIAIGYFNRDIRGMERKQALCLLAKSAALGSARAAELYTLIKKKGF